MAGEGSGECGIVSTPVYISFLLLTSMPSQIVSMRYRFALEMPLRNDKPKSPNRLTLKNSHPDAQQAIRLSNNLNSYPISLLLSPHRARFAHHHSSHSFSLQRTVSPRIPK